MKIPLTLLRPKVSVKMKTADENCSGGLRVESTDTKSESEDAFPERWDFVVDFPS